MFEVVYLFRSNLWKGNIRLGVVVMSDYSDVGWPDLADVIIMKLVFLFS